MEKICQNCECVFDTDGEYPNYPDTVVIKKGDDIRDSIILCPECIDEVQWALCKYYRKQFSQ